MHSYPSFLLHCSLLALLYLGHAASLSAQQDKHPSEGKTILGIEVEGAGNISKDKLLNWINTRVGEQLSSQTTRDDCQRIYRKFRLRCSFDYSDDKDGKGIWLLIRVEQVETYDRIVFQGLKHFEEERARNLIGIGEDQAQTLELAKEQAKALERRYRQEGFAHAEVNVRRGKKVLTFVVDEGPYVRVKSIRYIGNKSFSATAFMGLSVNITGSAEVKSTPGWFIFADSAYSEKTVQEDLDRIRKFYRSRGYRDAVVELQSVQYRAGRAGVDILIRITEGKLYTVESVTVEAIAFEANEKPMFSSEELLEVVKLKAGQALTSRAIRADRNRLALFYGRNGFPDSDRFPLLDRETSMRVLEPEEIADPDKGTIKIIYVVQEGKQKKVHDIKIRGNTRTRDPVIRREISLHPGDDLDMEELRRSEDRLRALRYFGDPARGVRGVDFRLIPVEGRDDLVTLEVEVSEGSTGSIIFGAGISSGRGLFGNLTYRKKNFDWTRPPSGINPIGWIGQIMNNEAFHGGGQQLQLSLSPGTEDSQARAEFFEPDVFGQHENTIGLSLTGFRVLSFFDEYRSDRLGGTIALEKNIGRDFSIQLGLRNERIRIFDLVTQAPAVVFDAEGKESLRSIQLRTNYRSLDQRRRPTSGFELRNFFEWAPDGLGKGTHFWKTTIDSRIYFPVLTTIRETTHVLTFRNRFEVGRSLDSGRDLFLTERLFMGGQSTLRGFDFRGAGPTQFGNPVGGEMMFLSSLEYGFPLFSTTLERGNDRTEILRGVIFSDLGLLGDDFDDPQFRDLRLSAGFGFRIVIPGLGGLPVALDLAWPIRDELTDDNMVFHFSFRF